MDEQQDQACGEGDQTYLELISRIAKALPEAVKSLSGRHFPISSPEAGTARWVRWNNELRLAWPLVIALSEKDGGLGVEWSVYLLSDGTFILVRFGLPPYEKALIEEVVCQRVVTSLEAIASFGSSTPRRKGLSWRWLKFW